MTVLVTGGRAYNDSAAVVRALDGLGYVEAVVCGGATGADFLAWEWAASHGVPVFVYRAQWRVHGRAAGPIRNQQMLDERKPDLVVAFPGGSGTTDMVRRAQSAGVPVRQIA